ncbi:MAG: hypothetical protein ACQEQL_04250 [Pseudomonadota bacterium]
MLKIFGQRKSRVLMGLAAVFMIGLVSFSTYQIFKPTPARAQCGCGAPCTAIVGGVSTAIAALDSGSIIPQLISAYNTVEGVYTSLMSAFNSVISGALKTAGDNEKTWYENFYAYDLTPAMQDQTGQLNTMLVDQSRQMASAQDGQQLNRTLREMDLEQIRSRREATPSESVCAVGTVSGGMARSRVITKAMKRALPAESLGISGNEAGSPSAGGDATYQKDRFDKYVAKYCNPDANGGTGCFGNPPAPYTDHDILVEEVIFQQDTLDIDTTPDQKEALDDLTRNLVEPEAPEVMPESAMSSADGREFFLDKRAARAQRTLAKKAVTDVIARRVPGSRMDTYVQALRSSAGVDLVEMSGNPSWNELVNTLAEERFWSGVYNMDNVTEPEAVTREKIAVQAIEVLQLNDVLDMYKNIALITASQAAQRTMATSPTEAGNLEDSVSYD